MSPEMFVALATGVATILASVGALVRSFLTSRDVREAVVVQERKLDTVHQLVNSTAAEQREEIRRLKEALGNRGASPEEIAGPRPDPGPVPYFATEPPRRPPGGV